MEVLIVVALVITFYFIPTVIAWQKDHDSLITIFFVNLLFGWTILGWLAAVIWAAVQSKPVVIYKTVASERDADPDDTP